MVVDFPTRARVFAVCGLLAGLGVASAALYQHFLPSDAWAPGLRVDGAEPHGASLAAFVAERAQQLGARKVTLLAGDKPVLETTLGALGVHVDEARVVALAGEVGRQGDLLGRARAVARARRGEIDVPLAIEVDDKVLSTVLANIKEAYDVAPLSARLDVEHKAAVPERLGQYIDASAAADALIELASGRGVEPLKLTLPTQSFAPRISSAFVKSVDVHTVLSEYVTYFSRNKDQSRRGQNIDVAAGKLDGLVLSPGELVSFNDVVGARSEENGFQKSWEIFKGEMVEGVGGGTCQVASTVHAAAFFAGLDIVERLPHSRPSAYIPMGLDATVVYPVVDMKLRNPFNFPIVLHAAVQGNSLHVSMLGRSRPATVSFSREVVETRAYPRKIEETPMAGAGRVIVKQHGIFGYRIERERVLRFRGGKERVEKNKDFYPPTTEIYDVPPGFDVSLLPPLPGVPSDDDSSTSAPAASAPAPLPGAAPTAPVAQNAVVTIQDAPGAHAPTTAQARPVKKVTIRR